MTIDPPPDVPMPLSKEPLTKVSLDKTISLTTILVVPPSSFPDSSKSSEPAPPPEEPPLEDSSTPETENDANPDETLELPEELLASDFALTIILTVFTFPVPLKVIVQV